MKLQRRQASAPGDRVSCNEGPVGQVSPEAGHLTVTRVDREHPTPTPLFVSFPDLECLPDTCPATRILSCWSRATGPVCLGQSQFTPNVPGTT